MDKREEMVLLMEEFSKSGQSQKDFSASKGMAFHTFNYWYRKLKKEKQTSGGFVQVDIRRSGPTAAPEWEVVYPNGVKLKVPAIDLSLLSQLIRLY